MPSHRTTNTIQRGNISVFGHFAYDSQRIDGQIQRTRLVASELKKRLGHHRIRTVDTGFLTSRPFQTISNLATAARESTDLVVMPGSRGLRWLFPLYLHWKRKFGLRIHFLAVGGWLPEFLKSRKTFVKSLRECEGIYVQSERMLSELATLDVPNVHILPNFRDFPLDRPTSQQISSPFRLVYLSRILPEKGPQLAIRAVEELNRQSNQTIVTLDLWGPIQNGCEKWFSQIIKPAPAFVQYHGVIPPETIPSKLANYDALVFPTYYSGEGFPGVFIDAMISGLPVIASDWQDNAEFIIPSKTGILFRTKDLEDLKRAIAGLISDPVKVQSMKSYSARRAEVFHVDSVFPKLLSRMMPEG